MVLVPIALAIRSHDERYSARLFDLSCPKGNLRSLPFGPTRMGPWMRPPRPATVEARRHDALNGVALKVRNSQLDKSASAPAAELFTVTANGTSRRNVLGAIALKRSIATSRSDDNRDECKQGITAVVEKD